MLSIGKLAAGSSAADYYLRRRAGCELDYYTGDGERAGVWCGHGAQRLGLTGELDDAAEESFRSLLAGRSPAGEQLVRPVLRADPRSRVPVADVIAAVRTATDRTTGAPALIDPVQVEVLARAAAALARSRRRVTWPPPSLPVDVAGRLLAAAGLDPVAVLQGPRGRDRFAAARRWLGARVDVRVPGLDFCLSAPKSVSMLFALADPATARAVGAAHRTATAAAIEHLERSCGHGMRGHHGGSRERYVDTDGLIGVAFEHRTSRAGDPQLHTHVVVANLLHGVDDRWGALDTREAYAQARTAGFVYQAVLRGELTRTLGVGWTPVHTGQAEIDGVPRGLLQLFSKRRTVIDAELDRLGRSDPAAAQRATLTTRPAKTTGQPGSLRQRWATEATQAGYDPATLTAVLGRVDPQPVPEPTAIAAQLLAPDGLTSHRSTFDRRDVLQGVCAAIPAGTPITLAQLRALATAVVRHRDAVPVITDGPVRSRRYSTTELLTVEADALLTAAQRTDDRIGLVDPRIVTAAIDGAGLSAEQAAMVRRVTGSGAGVEVVIGPAGSGKTRALAAAAAAWSAAGVPVQGAALAAIAARVLEDGAQIPARSLTRLMAAVARADPRRPAALPTGGVLIVDEAGMVGTRQLAQLIALTSAHRTKLLLVGDPHQLPEIEAGGLFPALADAQSAPSLLGNRRQRQRWEREALAELRDGDVPAALHAYHRHDRLRIGDASTDQLDRLIVDYREARQRFGPGQTVVVASSRADARRLNRAIRGALIDDGTLGARELRVPVGETERGYRVGEEVVVTANDYRRALLNGTRGTVTQLHPRAGALSLRLGDGRDIRLPAAYLSSGRLAHGYALTAHRAQGITVEVAMLWGSAALTRETGYVAMSRGRTANYLYATWEGLRRDVGDDIDRSRVGTTPTAPQRRDLARAALARRLEVTGAHRLAGSWRRERTIGRGGNGLVLRRPLGRARERDAG